jgi:hypothetical protein
MNKDNSPKVKVCPHCKQEVDPKATRCPHCQGKIPQWTLGKKIAAGIILFIFACVLVSSISGDSNSSSSSTTSTVAPTSSVKTGSNGYLRLPNNPDGKIFVATSKSALDEFAKDSVNKDTLGMAQLVENGGGYLVPQGTKVLVIDGTVATSEVRILEGDHIGAAVWVPYEFVSAN